jgi:hypothetical protein
MGSGLNRTTGAGQLSRHGGRGNRWQAVGSEGQAGQERPSAAERNKIREEQVGVRTHISRDWAIRVHAGQSRELRQQLGLRKARHAVQVEPISWKHHV